MQMLDLALLETTNPLYRPAWSRATKIAGDVLFRMWPRARIEIAGAENLAARPLIIAPNHTHKFDFFPLRSALFPRHSLITWIKARDYKDRLMAGYLSRTGNIPLASRGYVIACDFAQIMGRKPSEEEYRALREHVDEGTPLKDAQLWGRLERTPRNVLGTGCDPTRLGYGEAMRMACFRLMEETLRLARVGRDAGHHQHIYPQGATSSQLTAGRTGVVQAAIALGLPIIPVGISGCREVFAGTTPISKGGTITVRIGEAVHVAPRCVPADFRAFHPVDESRHKAALEDQTDRLMDRINELCEPSYRRAKDGQSDGKQGVARFYA